MVRLFRGGEIAARDSIPSSSRRSGGTRPSRTRVLRRGREWRLYPRQPSQDSSFPRPTCPPPHSACCPPARRSRFFMDVPFQVYDGLSTTHSYGTSTSICCQWNGPQYLRSCAFRKPLPGKD